MLPKQEQQKYAQLQEIIKKLDEEKKRGDSLLYAMIPKAVADRLRKGITALETCQVHTHLHTHKPTHSACPANYLSNLLHHLDNRSLPHASIVLVRFSD